MRARLSTTMTAPIERWNETLTKLREGIAVLRTAMRKARKIRTGDQRRDDTIDDNILKLLRPIFAAGLVHFILFGTLLLNSVWHSGIDLFALLLFDPSALQLPFDYLAATFPILSSGHVRPLAYALGTFYGALEITAALMLLSCGIPKLLIVSNGVYFGYAATAAIASGLMLVPATSVAGMAFAVKLGFLMLGFYLSLVLPRLIGGRGYAKEKYETLFSGTYGLFSGWILARGFGADAVVFSGGLFLLLTFGIMGVVEFLFSWLLRFFIALTGQDGRKTLNMLSLERGYTWEALRLGSQLPLPGDERELFLVLLGFLVSWPLLMGTIYVFALEGKTWPF